MKKKTSSETNLSSCSINSPLGKLTLFTSDKGLAGLCFSEFEKDLKVKLDPKSVSKSNSKSTKLLKQTVNQLRSYFDGNVNALSRIKTDCPGTPFQKKIWNNMRKTGAGRLISYSELAKKAGHPKAVRATGTACRNNPVALVIPCHRVVASDGKLTGYRGGLKRKRQLLLHEGATFNS